MSLLASFRRRALRQGLLGGSRTWLLLGGAAWTIRALQWALRPSPERVFRGDLEPGETYVITSRPAPPTRRQRRRMRRADRRDQRRSERLEAKASRRASRDS